MKINNEHKKKKEERKWNIVAHSAIACLKEIKKQKRSNERLRHGAENDYTKSTTYLFSQ